MGRLTCWTCLVILAVSLSQFQITEACSCSLEHPQTQFCNSDFVVGVRIQSMRTVDDREIKYKVHVFKIFKATENATLALGHKPVWLWTVSSDAMCGRVNLKVREIWVLGGSMTDDKPRISICGLAMPWFKTTPRQRKGFEKLYNSGCKCEITNYPDETTLAACDWNTSRGKCEKDHGVCLPNSTGCHWQHDVTYENCTAQYQRDPYSVESRNPAPNVHISQI